MREAARAIGFPYPALEVRGHDALEFRVARAHEEFVRGGRYVFRAGGEPARAADAVMFRWEMRATADDSIAGGGRDLLLLDAAGRIRVDYQFVDTLNR
jgi:hypothetical protein